MDGQASAADPRANRRWLALTLIAAAQFMVIMDTSIIGVALPEMREDLDFAPGDLSWVFNAYVVAFGGLLLLGGRLSDLLGARRVFAAGWAILLVGSIVAGAATNVTVELTGRAVQGVGAALIAPSALTLLMMLFGGNPRELTRALALYGAAAPAGGTAGVFLGGVLTEYASWPWVFYINIPIAALALIATPLLMPDAPPSHGRIDWLGALTADRWPGHRGVRDRAGTRGRVEGARDRAGRLARRSSCSASSSPCRPRDATPWCDSASSGCPIWQPPTSRSCCSARPGCPCGSSSTSTCNRSSATRRSRPELPCCR